MATYASSTNPFLKLNDETNDESNCNGQNSKQNKKNAPGMARPLSLLEELNKSKQNLVVVDSLLLDSPNAGAYREKEQPIVLIDENNNNNNNNNDSKEELLGTNPEPLESEQNELQTQVALLEQVIDQEIARTCRSLIEQAVISGEQGDGRAPSRQEHDQLQPPGTTFEGLDRQVAEANRKQDDNGQEDEEQTIQEDKTVVYEQEEEEEEGEEEEEASPKVDSKDTGATGTGRNQHIELIKKLRLQLKDLERYAHERGELERIPASVLLERQTVILDTLKKKLPHISILADKDKIEKLELEELKRQADDEINNLIDPLITKEHLLNQLKTQLTDLEKYVSHLHGTIGITNGTCPKAPAVGTAQAKCQCALHGCSQPTANTINSPPSPSSSRSRSSSHSSSATAVGQQQTGARQQISDALPKTSRLIRGLMAQLICSDIKIQEAMRLEKEFSTIGPDTNEHQVAGACRELRGQTTKNVITKQTQQAQFHDNAAWTLHIDRIILATDSLTNIYTLTQQPAANLLTATTKTTTTTKQLDRRTQHHSLVDNSLVDSVVRRQLVPAMRDLLAYGLIDPSSLPPRSSYVSFFDPYYLLSSLTCLPGAGTQAAGQGAAVPVSQDKVHVWHVIADYFETRNEPTFQNSSVKTLSQSFNLTSTMDGPIKITSKQALLIAVDDIIKRLARCKPNGPESHLKLFVYTALNQGKLATWFKIIFKNKSIIRKYYHNFSFVSQTDKMDRFLSIIDALGKFDFKLNTDTGAMDQFVSAF